MASQEPPQSSRTVQTAFYYRWRLATRSYTRSAFAVLGIGALRPLRVLHPDALLCPPGCTEALLLCGSRVTRRRTSKPGRSLTGEHPSDPLRPSGKNAKKRGQDSFLAWAGLLQSRDATPQAHSDPFFSPFSHGKIIASAKASWKLGSVERSRCSVRRASCSAKRRACTETSIRRAPARDVLP